jgi:hypothetical protein
MTALRKGEAEGVSDEELVRRAMEEADRVKREQAAAEAEELAARQSLGMMPTLPRTGPPPRGELGGGSTSGFQVLGGGGEGLRSVPHFKG